MTLVICMNATFLINFNKNSVLSDVQFHLTDTGFTIFVIFYTVHLLLSLLVIACEMTDRYPVIAYYNPFLKYQPKLKRNEKIKGFLNKFVLFLHDNATLYNYGYFFISCIGIRLPWFFAVLIVDIIKKSKDLMFIFKSLI